MATNTVPTRVMALDLDDTLMWTQYAYSQAFHQFYEFMREKCDNRILGITSFGTLHEQIDKELVGAVNPRTGKRFGYTMERFPESFARTYRLLCDDGFCAYSRLDEAHCRVIGLDAFNPLHYKRQGLADGAAEMLDFIAAQGDHLILLTKGERMVQECKVVTLELGRWFGDEIYIADDDDEDPHALIKHKDADAFRLIQGRFPESTVYSIGNSWNSDIQPALDAGVRAIYVPLKTWVGEEYRQDDHPEVIRVDRLHRIPGLYVSGQI